MSRRADELLRRMDRMSGAAPPAAIAPATPVPPPADLPRDGGSRRGRRTARGVVHFTVDLDIDLHKTLQLFAIHHEVKASDIIRDLIELLDDPIVIELLLSKLNEESDC